MGTLQPQDQPESGLQYLVNVNQASVNRAILAGLERLNDSFANFAANQFEKATPVRM